MLVLNGHLESFMQRLRAIELRCIDQDRGRLIEVDYAALPFAPRRTFVVSNVPAGTTRGGHAHKECEQILVCLQGRINIVAVLAESRAEIVLDHPRQALYVGPGVWTAQRYVDPGSQLLVCASLPFDTDHYATAPEPK